VHPEEEVYVCEHGRRRVLAGSAEEKVYVSMVGRRISARRMRRKGPMQWQKEKSARNVEAGVLYEHSKMEESLQECGGSGI
jgi:hypothetical protein